MRGMMTRPLARRRERNAADSISGHHAVVELVDDLIARHGADAPLLGKTLGDAKAAYWHGYTTLNHVDSRAFLTAAHASLDALDRVLVAAKQMERAGDRIGAPLLIDLKRRVADASATSPATKTRRVHPRVPAGATR